MNTVLKKQTRVEFRKRGVNLNVKQKCALFILFGQSNAVGHDLPMRECDKIIKPMKNVFGLRRDKNQSFDINRIEWSGYTSAGMNLGESQDNTYSIANCLAALWQSKIDNGGILPDLYIIHIAVGAQGISSGFAWNPEKEKRLVPGELGRVSISLYPFAMHILSLADKSFKQSGREYDIIGIHWRGGENDATVPLDSLRGSLENIYEKFFADMEKAVGKAPPIILHRLICDKAIAELNKGKEPAIGTESMDFINRLFESASEKHSNISVFDIRSCPLYDKNADNYGVFKDDNIHFTENVNKWTSKEILKEYAERLGIK